MVAEIRRVLAGLGVIAALSLAVLALAACGSTAEPTDEATATTAAPTTEPATATSDGGSGSASAASPEAQRDIAPKFTLPNARDGMEVSLGSFAGDKNVVLVFYRGFW